MQFSRVSKGSSNYPAHLVLGGTLIKLHCSFIPPLLCRPNVGFLEQLKLWGAMRCRLDQSNKAYRAYRLQHLAKNMIGEVKIHFLAKHEVKPLLV